MALTDTQIRNAKPKAKPFRLSDGNGLHVEVRPTGAKYWRYRYRIDGKENMFAAGEYVQPPARESASQIAERIAAGKMTLSEARVRLAEWRATVKLGKHPMARRTEQQTQQRLMQGHTFGVIARRWIASEKGWSASYAKQVASSFANHLYPHIENKPIQEIRAADLAAVLTGMTRLRRPTAGRPTSLRALPVQLRQWCSAVFRFGATEGLCDSDPTVLMRKRVKRGEIQNHTPLKPDELAAVLTRLDSYSGNPKTVIALRLLLLTFVRPGELRKAHWDEFDLIEGSWNIPEARMKMRKAHWVPLSKQAVIQLNELKKLTGTNSRLFPNERDPERYMSATTLNRCLERLGLNGVGTIDFSAHGFRATASTILNESGNYRADVIERQLAHVKRNVRAIYNKAAYADERRAMMQAWGDLVDHYLVTLS